MIIDNRRKSPDAFMPLWIGDYLADTTHLTTEQHGAYLLLLMAYWRRRGPLPGDSARLAAIAKVTPQKWRTLRLVMLEFFHEEDGLWKNKRADQELSKAADYHAKKVAAGQKGAEIRYSKPSTATVLPVANEVANAWHSSSSKQELTLEGSSPIGSNPENQNLVESLLVRAEPEPILKPASKPISSKVQRGTRWPADAVIPDDWVIEAAERRKAHSKPPIDLVLEAEKFRNYWSAKSGAAATKIDWRATWRNWALNSNGVFANGKGQFGNGRAISDHPLGIFAQLGDEIRERALPGSGGPNDHGGIPH